MWDRLCSLPTSSQSPNLCNWLIIHDRTSSANFIFAVSLGDLRLNWTGCQPPSVDQYSRQCEISVKLRARQLLRFNFQIKSCFPRVKNGSRHCYVTNSTPILNFETQKIPRNNKFVYNKFKYQVLFLHINHKMRTKEKYQSEKILHW